ncbi:MAG: hypothetical protein E3J71_03670 [Candidatus Stahlbacteria bacterium]|nr:MAG: hypothetical protein E3J71_03670 [Candidatus Stahlbacteria bacterium]
MLALTIFSFRFSGRLLPPLLAPRRLLGILKLLRPLRLLHYAGFAAGGAVMGAAVGEVPLDPYLLFYVTVSALVAFQGAVFLNDIFDAEIDRLAGKKTPFSRGLLGRRGSYALAASISIFSLILVLRCGLASFIFLLAAHVISLAYSTSPVRAKRIYPLNVFLLALAGLAVMVSGFASHASVRLFPLRMLILVVVTLTATFGTKDMTDVEVDRRRGIRTLFTLLGLGKGRWVNAGLVIVSYLLTPLILDYLRLYWAAAPLGVLTAALIVMRGRKKLTQALILTIYILFGLLILGLIAAVEIF